MSRIQFLLKVQSGEQTRLEEEIQGVFIQIFHASINTETWLMHILNTIGIYDIE